VADLLALLTHFVCVLFTLVCIAALCITKHTQFFLVHDFGMCCYQDHTICHCAQYVSLECTSNRVSLLIANCSYYQFITLLTVTPSSQGDPTCSTGIFATKKPQMITEDGYTHIERAIGSGVCDVSVCCPSR
jgi:hypothetical protein